MPGIMNLVHDYLIKIGRTPLLKKYEEKALALKVNASIYAKGINSLSELLSNLPLSIIEVIGDYLGVQGCLTDIKIQQVLNSVYDPDLIKKIEEKLGLSESEAQTKFTVLGNIAYLLLPEFGDTLKRQPTQEDEERFKIKREQVINEGLEAKEHLMNSNLRLVVSVAKKHKSNEKMPFIDLIQEGNIGLMHGVDKFDWRKGFKFSTYATWWIRQGISRGMAEKSRVIRLPVHRVEETTKIIGTYIKLEQNLGRQPLREEVATDMGITLDRLADIVSMSSNEPISLEETIGDNDAELQNFIASQDESPEDVATDACLSDAISKILDNLTKREKTVIVHRFGLQGENPKTLQEVGEILGVTRERIRQIEAKTIRKLRHPRFSRSVKDFAESPWWKTRG